MRDSAPYRRVPVVAELPEVVHRPKHILFPVGFSSLVLGNGKMLTQDISQNVLRGRVG